VQNCTAEAESQTGVAPMGQTTNDGKQCKTLTNSTDGIGRLPKLKRCPKCRFSLVKHILGSYQMWYGLGFNRPRARHEINTFADFFLPFFEQGTVFLAACFDEISLF
jgi:hypothetical protein